MKRRRSLRIAEYAAKKARHQSCDLLGLIPEMRGEILSHLQFADLAVVSRTCTVLRDDTRRWIPDLPPAWRLALDDVAKLPDPDDAKHLHRAIREIIQFGILAWPGVNNQGSVTIANGYNALIGWDWYDGDAQLPRYVRLCALGAGPPGTWLLWNNFGGRAECVEVSTLDRITVDAIVEWKAFVARADRRTLPGYTYGYHCRSICHYFYQNGSLGGSGPLCDH